MLAGSRQEIAFAMENASDFCGSILIADDHEVFRFGLVHLLTNSLKLIVNV